MFVSVSVYVSFSIGLMTKPDLVNRFTEIYDKQFTDNKRDKPNRTTVAYINTSIYQYTNISIDTSL